MFYTYFIDLTPTIWNISRLLPKDKLQKLILIMKYSLTISISIMCGFWIRRHLFKKQWILETHHIHRYMYSQCVLHIHNRQKNCHIGVGKFFMETGISPKRPLHPNSILRTDFNTEKFCHCYLLYCQFIHWSYQNSQFVIATFINGCLTLRWFNDSLGKSDLDMSESVFQIWLNLSNFPHTHITSIPEKGVMLRPWLLRGLDGI